MAQGKVRDKGKEAFWRRTVRRQGQSSLTVRAFRREHELRETAFYFRRRELAKPEAAQRRSTTFLPVRVTAAPARRVTAEARPAPRGVSQPSGGWIGIVLESARRIDVAPPLDRRALADVLAVLHGWTGALIRQAPPTPLLTGVSLSGKRASGVNRASGGRPARGSAPRDATP